MGSLISAKHLRVVREHVEDAVAKGARVLRRPPPPRSGPPLLRADAPAGRSRGHVAVRGRDVRAGRRDLDLRQRGGGYVAQEHDLDGLNFSVWTTDTARGRQFATRLHAGTVNVNEGYAATWASV